MDFSDAKVVTFHPHTKCCVVFIIRHDIPSQDTDVPADLQPSPTKVVNPDKNSYGNEINNTVKETHKHKGGGIASEWGIASESHKIAWLW
jgi:hypothetical protein